MNQEISASKSKIQLKQLTVLFLELLLALPFGLILTRLKIGGMSWLFGGIGAGIVILQACRIFYGYTSKPNRHARQIGMMLVGLTIGFSNAGANFSHIASGIPVFVFLTLFLLISGSCIGYTYSRLSQTNILTSMLATVPGGVGVMAAIAADYGKNVTLVALVQVIRVTCVVLLIPLIARVYGVTYVSPQRIFNPANLLNIEPAYLAILLVLFLICSLVLKLAVKIKLPAAYLFSALVVGLFFNNLLEMLPMFGYSSFHPPQLISIIGQTLLGITIGEYWGEKPAFGKKSIFYAIISTIMTLTAGAIASLIAMQLTTWDWLTCLLVTAPGGATEMILVALTMDHNVEIVTVGHLVRLIAINCSLPLWIYLFRRLDNQLDISEV
uniref:AbrB family transcriptional regulator n=1 Tax=Calothrix sp. PCC 6303 TaxID=1170562 RepID=UPI001EF0D6B9|nr:AbrB family transcriptional regulator [Calothrix sp. PCC 6303]